MNLEADDAFGILWTMQLLQSCSGDGWSTGLTCASHTEHLHLYPATGHKMVLSHPPPPDRLVRCHGNSHLLDFHILLDNPDLTSHPWEGAAVTLTAIGPFLECFHSPNFPLRRSLGGILLTTALWVFSERGPQMISQDLDRIQTLSISI